MAVMPDKPAMTTGMHKTAQTLLPQATLPVLGLTSGVDDITTNGAPVLNAVTEAHRCRADPTPGVSTCILRCALVDWPRTLCLRNLRMGNLQLRANSALRNLRMGGCICEWPDALQKDARPKICSLACLPLAPGMLRLPGAAGAFRTLCLRHTLFSAPGERFSDIIAHGCIQTVPSHLGVPLARTHGPLQTWAPSLRHTHTHTHTQTHTHTHTHTHTTNTHTHTHQHTHQHTRAHTHTHTHTRACAQNARTDKHEHTRTIIRREQDTKTKAKTTASAGTNQIEGSIGYKLKVKVRA